MMGARRETFDVTHASQFPELQDRKGLVPQTRGQIKEALIGKNLIIEDVIGDPKEFFAYEDSETGFRVTDIEMSNLSFFEIPQFSTYANGKISMQVVNKEDKAVGLFVRHIYLTDDGIIFRHVTAEVNPTGTGFGSRFHQAMEKKYRAIGVIKIIRICGDSIGRYEGAKMGFDFESDLQRQHFIKAFCDFLKKRRFNFVHFNGKRLSVDSLGTQLRTPQDILQVETKGKIKYVLEKRAQYATAGKAFFLDTKSKIKRNLSFTGVWDGIKYL